MKTNEVYKIMEKVPLSARLFMEYSRLKGQKVIASINVTNWCNLHCAGCYWQKTSAKENHPDMSREYGLKMIRKLREDGVYQILYIGGEPMARRDVLDSWVREFAMLGGINTVITNGTYGLPKVGEWPSTHYFVSCDGDKFSMDKIRGKDPEHNMKNVFDTVTEVVRGRKDVVLTMTINSLNYEHIEGFTEYARGLDVGGAVFSLSTPNVGEHPPFYLNSEQRDVTVEKLLKLKTTYGDFIATSRRTIELLGSKYDRTRGEKCPTDLSISLNSDGSQIERCIFGPKGDCSRCGCNITAMMRALLEGDRETAKDFKLPMRKARIT